MSMVLPESLTVAYSDLRDNEPVQRSAVAHLVLMVETVIPPRVTGLQQRSTHELLSCCIHINTETSVQVHLAQRSQLNVTCFQLS